MDDKKLLTTLTVLLRKTTVTPFRRHGSKHKCFFCEKCFQHVTELRKHTSTKHLSEQTLENSISESLIKLDITDLQCKLCSLKIDGIEEMLVHLNKEHDENLGEVSSKVLCFKLTDEDFACLFCAKKFKLFGTLLQHIDCNHLDKNYACEACEIKFASKTKLLVHTRDMHSIGAFHCVYCKKKFFNKCRRDVHMKRYHESRRNCLVCSKVFANIRDKDQHMYKEHSQEMQWYKCDRCPLKFKLKRLLIEHHKRVHLKEKNVTCEICGMTFFSTGRLNLHKVRHSDAKPFECATCGKKFPRKFAMELHVRIHTNERRYSCKICGKAFIQWTSLQYHLPQHSDERNFKCLVCGKAFKTKKTMLKHCVNVHGKKKLVEPGISVDT